MKLFSLFIYALACSMSINAYADDAKNQVDGVQPQQMMAQTVEANKTGNQQVKPVDSHRHDVMKTQFLGKRPYMETKAK